MFNIDLIIKNKREISPYYLELLYEQWINT
jgi:hypothetical protein